MSAIGGAILVSVLAFGQGPAEELWKVTARPTSVEGPYGVMFRPRYDRLEEGVVHGPQDLARFELALKQGRIDALQRQALLQRRDAVVHWIHVFHRQASQAGLSVEDRHALLEQITLLRFEDSVLELQLSMLGGLGVAAQTMPMHRYAYYEPLQISADQVALDAIVVGDQLVVSGHVTGDATAFGGDVIIEDGGRVDGQVVAFGGTVVLHPAAAVTRAPVDLDSLFLEPPQIPEVTATPSWFRDLRRRTVSFLTFGGAGILALGLFPDHISRIAESVDDRPVKAMALGIVGAGSLLLASGVFAITLIGLPISFVLLAGLGIGWLMGFVALCQAVGDKLPFRQQHHGRWLVFLLGILLLSSAGAMSTFSQLVVTIAGLLGLGATLGTWFGRR